MDNLVIDNLSTLFRDWSGESPQKADILPASGSDRRYVRLASGKISAMGTFNPHKKENEAFVHFSKVFNDHHLNVPEIYRYEPGKSIYLQEDLGETTLFSLVANRPDPSLITGGIRELYERSVCDLLLFQVDAGKDLDYNYCHPRKAFDEQSVQWDLNYFKYNYLNLSGIKYDEQLLEEDFREIRDFISGAPADYFMYRDFQARNILLKEGSPWYIDYQGGRKGPLQYDLVSLLYQVRARLPQVFRDELTDIYVGALEKKTGIKREEFYGFYPAFILLRLLQVLGAYGFRGLYQGKAHFLESLSMAYNNISLILERDDLSLKIPEIRRVLGDALEKSDSFRNDKENQKTGLTVTISSFSYKKGIPKDTSGHGGGFVFDCRALPNPGREERFRLLNGKDPEVKEYLEKSTEVEEFISNIFNIVDTAVEKYLSRGFSNLMVSFGCTGGQHRSVYCAERLSSHLKEKYEVNIRISHTEIV